MWNEIIYSCCVNRNFRRHPVPQQFIDDLDSAADVDNAGWYVLEQSRPDEHGTRTPGTAPRRRIAGCVRGLHHEPRIEGSVCRAAHSLPVGLSKQKLPKRSDSET